MTIIISIITVFGTGKIENVQLLYNLCSYKSLIKEEGGMYISFILILLLKKYVLPFF